MLLQVQLEVTRVARQPRSSAVGVMQQPTLLLLSVVLVVAMAYGRDS
jgi:hypothetical protein